MHPSAKTDIIAEPGRHPAPPVVPRTSWPRAMWYPTVESATLRTAAAQEAAIAFTLLDEHIALWLDPSGRPAALADRCAHEGARLSKGICKKEGLICRFHGWAHDRDGKALPPGHRYRRAPEGGWGSVTSYRTAEYLDQIWVALEDPTLPLPFGNGVVPEHWTVRYSARRRLAQPADIAFAEARERLAVVAGGHEVSRAPLTVLQAATDGSGQWGLLVLAATPIGEGTTQLSLHVAAQGDIPVDSAALQSVLTGDSQ